MNKRNRGSLVLVLGLALLLTGCGKGDGSEAVSDSWDEGAYSYGSSSQSTSSYDYTEDASDEYDEGTDAEYNDANDSLEYDEGTYADDDAANGSGGDAEAEIVKNTMMIIRDASLSVDVADLEAFDDVLQQRVSEYGGYFEESTINDYSSEYATNRWSYYTIRIPQDKLDDFLTDVEGAGSVSSQTITSEDVSLDYVDITARISALESEKENLLRLMDAAAEVSDIIEIENRLTDVQYQLDSYNGKKRVLEGRVSYSTVSLSAQEERNIDHPIAQAFDVNIGESMLEGVSTAVNVFVGVLSAIPVILVLGAFAMLFIWIWRVVWKKIFHRQPKTGTAAKGHIDGYQGKSEKPQNFDK